MGFAAALLSSSNFARITACIIINMLANVCQAAVLQAAVVQWVFSLVQPTTRRTTILAVQRQLVLESTYDGMLCAIPGYVRSCTLRALITSGS